MCDLVSAIIVTHNRAALLVRAIESVLNQTYSNMELIVVDDGSDDNMQTVVADYINHSIEIRFYRNDIPKGACAARNLGLKEAKGKYIAGLDDDDEWHAQRVEVLLAAYKEEYSFVCASDEWKGDDGKVIVAKREGIISKDSILFSNVVGNQILTTRDKILSIGGFDEELPSAQDYDTWVRLVMRYGSAFSVPEVLQTMYIGDQIKRITTSSKKFKGYFMFYNKHKSKMSLKHRRFQLFVFYKIRKKKMSIRTLCSLIDGYRPIYKIILYIYLKYCFQ